MEIGNRQCEGMGQGDGDNSRSSLELLPHSGFPGILEMDGSSPDDPNSKTDKKNPTEAAGPTMDR